PVECFTPTWVRQDTPLGCFTPGDVNT
ncbi:MAG: hypothetical protein QOH53_2291, partial [Ilumatobacteraceae bacterium]